jgi:hypothetical protein
VLLLFSQRDKNSLNWRRLGVGRGKGRNTNTKAYSHGYEVITHQLAYLILGFDTDCSINVTS